MGFKEPSLLDRQTAALKAKKDLLAKFKAQPGADDPEVKKKQAERQAIATQRAESQKAREAAKVEQKKRDAELAAEAAAQIEREKAEQAAAAVALEAEQKAARDARYAARKSKKKKK